MKEYYGVPGFNLSRDCEKIITAQIVAVKVQRDAVHARQLDKGSDYPACGGSRVNACGAGLAVD